MNRLLTAVVGLSLFAGTAYAGSPRLDSHAPNPAALAFSGATTTQAFLSQAGQHPNQDIPTPDRASRADELERWAYKISYIGSLILTADQIVRSVDSVMESMELTRQDGTNLRLLMGPESRGFEVMVRMSRPLEF